jgi:predicted dehydrogenase
VTPQATPPVGVIGAGNWGKNVVRTFHGLGALAAVAEANTAMHPALAAAYPGVPVFEEYRDMLAGPVKAVVVATPAPSHHAIAREALLAGKDVLVEKPMTLSTTEAADLVALANQQGRILMVGHLLLFQPAVQWIKAYLESGALGRVCALYQERLNLGKARAVENALWSLGVHDVAVMLYLMGGAPDRVEAIGQCVLQPAIEDDVHLHLGFAGGAQAHLHTSWLWPEKRRRLGVLGTAGMLVYDELDQTVTLHRTWITPDDLRNCDQGSAVLFRGSGEPLALEAAHFLECVATRSSSLLASGAHGLEVVRVLELASLSLAAERGGEHARPAPGPDPAAP